LKDLFDASYLKKFADKQKTEKERRIDLNEGKESKPIRKEDIDLFAEF